MDTLPILFVCAGEPDAAVCAALEQTGRPRQTLALNADDWPDCRLAVVDSANTVDAAAAFVKRWRARLAGREVPVIWIADALDPLGRTAGWQAGADAVLVRPLAFGELAAQIDRLLRWREERDRLAVLAGEASQINQTLIQLYRQVDADFRIARRIQRSCRPANLPAVGRARFAVCHRERMGSAGDFYDVKRVDEERVAFLLGDVLGPSLTASMLAVFLHQSVVAKDIDGQSYQVVQPDEVLRRLNRNLGALGMPEPPMVRLTYALLNGQTGELAYSDAGHTPPLYLPASGAPELWREVGPLLGPVDTKFPVRRMQLHPGDRLLLFTDGLHGTTPDQAEDLLRAAEPHRALPFASLLECLTQDLLTSTAEPDDFTMLGVEIT
jgi:serine phosphatase RsbU (regulator of sigma subunit)